MVLKKENEALIIIYDIGADSLQECDKDHKSFFDAAKECILKILQQKITSKSDDEAGLILMGTEESKNELHTTLSGYNNISEAFDLAIPTWKKLRIIKNKVQATNQRADWLDAIIVAVNFLKNSIESKKFTSCKVIIFSTFGSPVNAENIDNVISSFVEMQISLFIISNAVENSKTANNFSQDTIRSGPRQTNEQFIVKIVEKTNGVLYDIKYAETLLSHMQTKTTRSMPFNCDLEIGRELKIKTSGFKYVCDSKPESWKITGGPGSNFTIKNRLEMFKNEKTYDPDPENMIDGYMYGTTVVPYDSSLVSDYQSGGRSFMCLGFTARSNILDEYLYGDDTSIVVANKDFPASIKLFTALIEVLISQNMVMIARKVYNIRSAPKMYACFPVLKPDHPPMMTMLELPFAENLIDLNIPSLNGKRFQTTQEQNDAIDDLIDSMDLMTAHEDENGECGEAFDLGKIPNPATQHILRTIAFKALNPKEKIPNTIDEQLTLQVPPAVLEKATASLESVKSQFKLETIQKPAKVAWQLKHLKPDEPSTSQTGTDHSDMRVIAIGSVTPAEDFALLLRNGEQFSTLCTQLHNIITDLVFKQINIQTEKVAKAIMIYREEAKLLGPFHYNKWIESFKTSLIARKCYEFWEEAIVKEGLGLIGATESDLSTVSDAECEEFYKLGSNQKTTIAAEVANIDMDDLFEEM